VSWAQNKRYYSIIAQNFPNIFIQILSGCLGICSLRSGSRVWSSRKRSLSRNSSKMCGFGTCWLEICGVCGTYTKYKTCRDTGCWKTPGKQGICYAKLETKRCS